MPTFFFFKFFFFENKKNKMAYDNTLRPIKETIFKFIAVNFKSTDPNTISFISLLFGIICSYFCYLNYYWLSILCWNLNRIFDGLDGVIARVHNKQTDFGGYIDLVYDFIVYCLVPIGIVANDPTYSKLITLSFLQMSYTVNAVGWLVLSAILEKKNKISKNEKKLTTLHMPSGLIEGLETIILYNLMLLFPSYNLYLMILFTVLVFVTVIQRVNWARINL